ncbi:PREDICTED: regulator of microtubule dynamics protein 1-like isoform X2 [Priapulus caudatus]|uniref:Regulator of microtubule dynamics protein 1 n=1 Tax=Priapulus caudatus TaxID=37621 RepID=A0ABM1F4M3_PRICU|nr:PREDICTED: regulator of microtubule dynamics protein 1-like isoform X2 [Priapulus caudatus]
MMHLSITKKAEVHWSASLKEECKTVLLQPDDTRNINKKVDDEIVEMADNLYDHHEVDKLYEFLSQYKDSKNDEIQWRLARAASDKSKKETDETKKKELTYEGLHHAEIAVKLNENNFAAHKWYAAQLAYVGFYGNFKIQIQNSYIVRDHFGWYSILLDYMGRYEGVKFRIANSFGVKEHLLKAIALNPQDATSIHSLGYWCFVFADMPWYQRKIASMLFATPPTSTYEEALKYFLDAENVDPNFYSMNLTMLGKTYMRIGNKKMALLYLSKAHEYPVKTEDDKDAHKEAGELLASLGVKS